MRVVILAPPGVQSLDVVGPAELFWEAARRTNGAANYDVRIMGATADPIRGTGNLRFLPDCTIDDPDEEIDTLLVPGDTMFADRDQRLVNWLRRRVPTVRRYGSICCGAFLLAAAGLIEGRRVTTHWDWAGRLQSSYPNVIVDSEQIFIQDGNLCTSAGVSAGMDLALALIEEDFGRELALGVAQYMLMFLKRPGGQSQFSAHLAAQMSGKTPIQRAQEHALANLSGPLTVEALAHEAGMSVRNFARVFRQEMKMTPADFVEAARIDEARRMLQDSSASLQRIADACGFGHVDVMRRTFMRKIGVGPSDYRRRFKTALNAPRPERDGVPAVGRLRGAGAVTMASTEA